MNVNKLTKTSNLYLKLSNPMRSVAGQITIQRHLYLFGFPSMKAFVDSLNYDPSDFLTKKNRNFWYKFRAGRALSRRSISTIFLQSVNKYTEIQLNHYLWHFIDQTINPSKALSSLPRSIKRQVFKKQQKIAQMNSRPLHQLKRSYPSQRENLFNQLSLDSFAALLLIALTQKEQLKHTRPTSAEKYAYALFLYLFGYKYRTLRKKDLGRKINLLLTGDFFKKNIADGEENNLDDFEQVEVLKKLAEENNKSDVDKFVSEAIKKFIFSKKDHLCFLKY